MAASSSGAAPPGVVEEPRSTWYEMALTWLVCALVLAVPAVVLLFYFYLSSAHAVCGALGSAFRDVHDPIARFLAERRMMPVHYFKESHECMLFLRYSFAACNGM